MRATISFLAVLLVLGGSPGPAPAAAGDVLAVVDPPSVQLEGPGAVQSLLVHGRTAEGRLIDLTRSARYRSLGPEVAAVSPTGVIRGESDGSTIVVVGAP